jgi:hypothetical protein
MVSVSVEGRDEVAEEKPGDDSDDPDDKGDEDNFDDIDDMDDTPKNMDTDGKSNNDGMGSDCGPPKSGGIGNRNIKSVVVKCSDEGSDKQTPYVISHLYEIGGEDNGAEGILVVGAKTSVDVVQLNEVEDSDNEDSKYHTQFLCQNQVLIICMTQDQLFHTYGQKCSQITICHK